MSDMLYLVLRNGYKLNDLILTAGDIYTSEDFKGVNEQRKVALVLGRIIYRGSETDVKDKRAKFFGITDEGEDLSKKRIQKEND